MAKRGRSSSSSSRNAKSALKIFDRAYDKCARLKPGETVKLFPLEEEILLGAIRKDNERRDEAKQAQCREHLRQLGWSEEEIAKAGRIPGHVLLLSNRKLTQEEKAYALTLRVKEEVGL